MNFQNTMTRVYAGIVAIPVAALLFAGAIGSSGGSAYDYERDLESIAQSSDAGTGTALSEAEAYGSLGKYNPCIFIECEGE